VENFAGRIAVVTGGGTGMGRELVCQLAAEGCHVAACDVFADSLHETRERAERMSMAGTRVFTHLADVSDESQVKDFGTAITNTWSIDHVDLVFNNAGVAGGGGFVDGVRDEWERTFNIDFFGVYYGCRTFLPLLLKSDRGHLVNTSSVNGLIGSLGPGISHTAYSAAKFAVRGFTESLITDFRLHAPHVSVHLVMPGHIGTSIVLNTTRLHFDDDLPPAEVERIRQRMAANGMDSATTSDEDIRKGVQAMGEAFRDTGLTSASDAATIILDAVRAGTWRILVGPDAKVLDEMVRAEPDGAYDAEFWERLMARWNQLRSTPSPF
jgi:NAD(P)-dependent dehydrogenase (short-subunit alcohol dehydrogenase family)